MQHDYIDAKYTSRLIKIRLRGRWRGHKFILRPAYSKHGSSNLGIFWTDGPTEEQVNEIVSPFAGSVFDMQALKKYPTYSWLDRDGVATKALCESSIADGGTLEGYETLRPSVDAEFVRFGIDYIHCKRTISPELEAKGGDPREIDAYVPPPPRGRVHRYLGPTIWQDPDIEIERITVIDYNEKAYVLRGPGTRPLRKELWKRFKGRPSYKLRGGFGWVFSKKHTDELREYLENVTGRDFEELGLGEPIDDFI